MQTMTAFGSFIVKKEILNVKKEILKKS